MSENTTTTEAPAEEPTATGGNSGYTPPASQADLDKIIADRLSRERAKFGDYEDLKTKAAEYDKVVAANQTEAEKQAARLAELEAEVSGYKTREQVAAWISEVAAATGVPAAALRGSTKEEIEAHAESLKSLISDQPTSHRPIRGEGSTAVPLNGSGIESALKSALGIS